ncbi:hypothetical protein [Pseudomonas monsensis]|uniref:hypothetical protein n=1 Tax=Pseudomonas monsensis TaxID=2745509 RepID=UPI00300EDB82
MVQPEEYWEDLDDEERAEINQALMADRECSFMDLDEDDQWEYLAECDEHTVTCWKKRWEIVDSHFTRDAAEAFIRRKQHDYSEMRVYVESQNYAWEFEAIKDGYPRWLTDLHADGRGVIATSANLTFAINTR